MLRSDRKSGEITGSQADNLWAAAFHAEKIGKPLNAFLTIHWDNQGGDKTVQEQNSRMLICARRWLGRRDQDLAAVWVIERGTVSGPHAHNLIHVPRRLLTGFKDMLPKWTEIPALPKNQWPAEQRKSQHVLGYGQDGIWELRRVYDNVGLQRYILKGVKDRWHGLGIRHKDQGLVIGKRCGSSHNLGGAARLSYQPPTAAA